MATAKHPIVRMDRVKARQVGHIHSAVYTEDILENGNVGVIGDFLDGEAELVELKVPEGTEEPIALVYQEEIMYDESTLSSGALENFYIEQGKPARTYELREQDIYSVTKDGLDLLADDAVKGNYVVAQSGSLKLEEVATVTGDEAFIGKIMDTEKIGTAVNVGSNGVISRQMDFVVIRVEKNYK